MSSVSSMRDDTATAGGAGKRRLGGLALMLLAATIMVLRGLTLLYDHSLHSIDGAMQTWFALDNFARGEKLGTGFQSYLGVSMMLGLVPAFLALGGTLFASTLAAHIAVIAGAFATAYALAWMIRWIGPRQRWMVAVLLVFAFYYVGGWVFDVVGLRYPLAFDPGVSLRPVRALLPVLVLPVFVWSVRRSLRRNSVWPMIALGVAAGVGLLWSNDSGIPLSIALVVALALAMLGRGGLLVRSVVVVAIAAIATSTGILLAVTHGEPGPWLQYNFRDVAGDQFWYFAPWDPETRVLSVADLPNILTGGDLPTTVSLVLLGASILVFIVRGVRAKGLSVREAGFVLVGATTLGTALIPQVGGHIEGSYNNITFMLGLCAPVILFQCRIFSAAKQSLRAMPSWLAPAATGAAVAAMIAVEAVRLLTIANESDREIRDPALGFLVEKEVAVDLAAMRWLADRWDDRNVPNDRRLLSVYTSALDVAAETRSPAPVGSLIHALGAKNRDAYAALVANREVEAVTTIHPGYSGWEEWMLRANWPFFRQLRENYRPVATNGQQVLWSRGGGELPVGEARCSVTAVSENAARIVIEADEPGWASVSVERGSGFATGRTAILTVTETSPATRAATGREWTDFPRYGVANAAQLSLVAPVEPGEATGLLLEVIDGSPIGSASCSARVYPQIDYATLPGLPAGIARYLAEGE